MSSPHPPWMDRVQAALGDADPEYFARFQPPPERGRESAVLMLFGPCEGGGTDVVLTERSHDLRSHAAQVSFPGGSLEPGDATPTDAALREAREEVGIDPAGVEVVAELPELFLTPSRFVVTPVLAWWPEPQPLGPIDAREVARAARVPLDHLLAPRARFTVTHPSGYRGPAFEVDGLFVWGFTAMLLTRVLQLADLDRPWDDSVHRDLPERFQRGVQRDLRRIELEEGTS